MIPQEADQTHIEYGFPVKKSDPFARQKNRTTNEYRQFPRLKWVVHSVHEAEQTRAAPENENITAVA